MSGRTQTEGIYVDTETHPLTWARRYSDLGLRMVILHGLTPEGVCTCSKGAECRSAGKHPVAGAWQKTATSDYEEIRKGLSGETPRNLGLAMGQGWVTLDVDGPLGQESFGQLMAEHGNAWVGAYARTGSGGYHFLFQTDESFPNTVKLLPGLDVRSMGAQIVACPSMHKSGQRYVWIAPPSTATPLPDFLADIMRGTVRLEWDAKGWLAKQAPAVSGENGNKTFMSVAGTLIRQGRVRTLEAFLTVIEPWNQRCIPPWSEHELSRGFENALGRFSAGACVELPVSKDGAVICTRSSLDRIVREDPRYEWAFDQNVRTGETRFNGAAFNDLALTSIEVEICNRYSVREIKREQLRQSIELRASTRGFDPVIDYLSGLRWDGTSRLARVPAEILEADPAALNAALFKRWAIAAVRRARNPGIKVDDVLILQGGQGIGKSRFFRAMAGDENFADTPLDLASKDVYQQIAGRWIIEWAELTSIRKFEVERVKAFLSSQEDRYRRPYDRYISTQKRAGVIVGTTNAREFLSDPTGNRRMWVIACRGAINVARVLAERDQIWAEAAALEASGEPHWLTDEEEAARSAAVATFEVHDPIYSLAGEIIDSSTTKTKDDQERIRWEDVMSRMGAKPVDWSMPKLRDSIARALRDRGFDSRDIMENGKKRRYWVRPAAPPGGT